MAEDFTSRFRVDVSDLKAGLAEARKEIKNANAAFKAETAGMDSWKKDADGLTAKIRQLDTVLNQQKSILQSYQEQLRRQQDAYEQNGKRAEELRSKLQQLASQGVDKASAEYKKYESALQRVESEQERNEKAITGLNEKIRAQSLSIQATENETSKWTRHLNELQAEEQQTAQAAEQVSTATGKMGNGFTVVKGVVSNLITQGLQKLGQEMKSVVTDSAAYADEIITLSKQTGVSAEQLQKFAYMSELVDVDTNTVAKSMAKLTKTMASAQGGSASAAENFESLGVSITDTNGQLRDNEDVFNDVVAALGTMDNETERDAKAMAIFGKSAQALNPLIEAGADQIAAWSKEAEDMGYVMDEDMLNGLSALQDSFDRFDNRLKAVKNTVAAGLAPAIDKGTQKLTDMTKTVDWKKFGNEVGDALGDLIDGLGWIIKNGDTIKGILAGILAAFAVSKIMQAVQGIQQMTKALITMNAAANANPYVLLASAIVGLAVATVSWLESAQEAYIANNTLVQGMEDSISTMDAHIEQINAMAEAYDAAQQAREESMNAGLAEMEYVQELSNELDTLVDTNGNVKKSDEDRAKFILGELNSALGTEYTLTDLQVQKYQELKQSVKDLIEQKQAEIILKAQEEALAEALTKRGDAQLSLETATRNYNDAVAQMAVLQAQVDTAMSGATDSVLGFSAGAYGAGNDVSILLTELQKAKDKVDEYGVAMETNAELVDKYAYDITQYQGNATKAINEDYKSITYQSWETAKAQGQASSAASEAIKTNAASTQTQWLKDLSAMVSAATGKKVEFQDAGGGMVKAIGEGLDGKKEIPIKQLQGMGASMTAALNAVAPDIAKSGGNIPAAIAQGIKAGSSPAYAAIQELAAGLVTEFNKDMKINSPAKVMIPGGEGVSEGVAVGISKGSSYAFSATKKLATGIENTFATGINPGAISGAANAIRGAGGGLLPVGGTSAGSHNTVVNNNYTQNNYSPKALSRLDIYRDSKNLLQLVKGNA